ncbi:uncharacterized protein IL334_003265 [Kwoniella shivajii]|uniref:Uncharacterized protein n=1 Tax=Kwoniella shivajii TaxID=564305 RepID=A0ABZ1CX31_9TREE|nr:hypothetical protein IL334_003265 [Kwoniella shivajii]
MSTGNENSQGVDQDASSPTVAHEIQHHNPFRHPHDSCEAEPGLIESTDLAPLNHEVLAADHPAMMQGQAPSRTSKNM